MNHPVLPAFCFAPERQRTPRRASAVALVLVGLMGPAMAVAQAVSATPPSAQPTATGVAPATQSDLSEGEVVRWDPRTGKVTLRHGPIKNLDRPPMTWCSS